MGSLLVNGPEHMDSSPPWFSRCLRAVLVGGMEGPTKRRWLWASNPRLPRTRRCLGRRVTTDLAVRKALSMKRADSQPGQGPSLNSISPFGVF